jgi:hypothetical protein
MDVLEKQARIKFENAITTGSFGLCDNNLAIGKSE